VTRARIYRGTGGILSRQQYGELVAAKPGDDTGLAQPGSKGLPDPDDEGIARAVALGVVLVLEVVEIDDQHRAGRPKPLDSRDVIVELPAG
jgi:hypothetical protein